MASSIASFNLKEICDTTIALMKNPEHEISDTLLAPDFVGGGYIIYNKDELDKIYQTGRGSVKVRAKYKYDKSYNCIDITEIPPTTTSEAIIDKIVELVKTNKVKELSDIRDETDLKGLRITLDLKRGVEPDKLMTKLYKMTPLEDTFSCNFNVLIKGYPKVLGVRDILKEWIEFRLECVRRRTKFTLDKKAERLHLLEGLDKILLDIDKAIKIIRETESESEVVPNLMIGFGIDQLQAEYVAEIKLRHLNREYILKRTKDIENLIAEIAELNSILESQNKQKKIIVKELTDVAEKYSGERRSEILYEVDEFDVNEVQVVEDYPVTLFITEHGYLNKIRTANLRMSGEQKVKEGDSVIKTFECSNKDELLVFTDKAQVYKAKVDDFADGKASVLGTYVAGKLEMEPDEKTIFICVIREYKGYMIFAFENGKVAKVDISAYQTKTNRKKLLKAYSSKVPLACCEYIEDDTEFVLCSSNGRMLILNTASINSKSTKDTIGVAVMTQKKNQKLESMHFYQEGEFEKAWRFRTKNLPAAGALPTAADNVDQISF
jgi:DNA gyrase subunit A